jgi:hypothetical protein
LQRVCHYLPEGLPAAVKVDGRSTINNVVNLLGADPVCDVMLCDAVLVLWNAVLESHLALASAWMAGASWPRENAPEKERCSVSVVLPRCCGIMSRCCVRARERFEPVKRQKKGY